MRATFQHHVLVTKEGPMISDEIVLHPQDENERARLEMFVASAARRPVIMHADKQEDVASFSVVRPT